MLVLTFVLKNVLSSFVHMLLISLHIAFSLVRKQFCSILELILETNIFWSADPDCSKTSQLEKRIQINEMTDKEEKPKHFVRIRAAHRGGATKLTAKLDTLLLKAESIQLSANDKKELANIKKTLEMKLKHLALYDQQIEELIEDEDDLDTEVYNCLERTQRYVGYLEKIKNLEAPPLPSPTYTLILTSSPVSSSTSRQFNLPKLEPHTFNGEYMQWTSYWDLFDASVHKNTSLTNAQKLQCLKRPLKVESVSKLISHLSVTDANYDTARKILETRYSNKRLIVRSHIQAMMSFPPLTQESAEWTRQLLECFQETHKH